MWFDCFMKCSGFFRKNLISGNPNSGIFLYRQFLFREFCISGSSFLENRVFWKSGKFGIFFKKKSFWKRIYREFYNRIFCFIGKLEFRKLDCSGIFFREIQMFWKKTSRIFFFGKNIPENLIFGIFFLENFHSEFLFFGKNSYIRNLFFPHSRINHDNRNSVQFHRRSKLCWEINKRSM